VKRRRLTTLLHCCFITAISLCLGHINAQQTSVNGIISDEDPGEPVPVAEVAVENTSIKATTAGEGAFSLEGRIPELFVLSFTLRDVKLQRPFTRTGYSMDLGALSLPR
jgi:hypothetical protein